jgi:hypothetical protein
MLPELVELEDPLLASLVASARLEDARTLPGLARHVGVRAWADLVFFLQRVMVLTGLKFSQPALRPLMPSMTDSRAKEVSASQELSC